MVRAGTKAQPLLMFKVTPAQAEPCGIPQELQRLGVRALLSTPSPFRSLRHTQHSSTASFGAWTKPLRLWPTRTDCTWDREPSCCVSMAAAPRACQAQVPKACGDIGSRLVSPFVLPAHDLPSLCGLHCAGTQRFTRSNAADTKPYPSLFPLLTGVASPPSSRGTAPNGARAQRGSLGKALGKGPLAPPAKGTAVAGRSPSPPSAPEPAASSARARRSQGAAVARRAVPPRVPPRSAASTAGTEWPRRARHGQGVRQPRARMGGGPGPGRASFGSAPNPSGPRSDRSRLPRARAAVRVPDAAP